jgi:iron complex transport system permease protein
LSPSDTGPVSGASPRPGGAPWRQVGGRSATIGLAFAALAAALVSLAVGRYQIPLSEVIRILVSAVDGSGGDGIERHVVLIVRLPRVLLALCAGAGLSLCGAALQGVFRNPLVGPHIVGVSTGAAVGGTLAILVGGSQMLLLVSAFVCGMSALAMVWALHLFVRRRDMLVLVLAGVIVGGFFGALVSLVQYLSDAEEKLPRIVFWLLGSFATADWERLGMLIVPLVGGGGLLLMMRWRIDVLSLGEEEAQGLGIRVEPTRWAILASIGAIVAAQVAVSGVIGWIGLVVPHLARVLVGPGHRRLLPASMFAGGLFMVLVDDLARTLTGNEIPLGILTALIGAPVFAIVFLRIPGAERGHG